MSLEAVLAELHRCAGGDFDPELVRLFVQLIDQDLTLMARLSTHRI